MKTVRINGHVMHYREDGTPGGPVLFFSNSLGTELRIWDAVVAHMPPQWHIIRYDKRGHGLSEATAPPYFMGDLVADAAGLLDYLGLADAVVVGLSIGGLIAQGLAAERPDLVRALVLSNTAAKIGTEDAWNTRIDAARSGGLASIAPGVMERWFSPQFLRENTEDLALWQAMMERSTLGGYTGCCAAIAGTDLLESTARLRLPSLVVAGKSDGATPPDLVRELAGLIEGARFEMISSCGHLPPAEQPAAFAALLQSFLDALPEREPT